MIEQFNDNDSSDNALAINSLGDLTLKLANEPRTRSIGQIFQGRDTYYYYKTVKSSNVMRINNSIGLHFGVIEKLPEDSGVLISLGPDHKRLYVSKKDILAKGTFLHFKKEGFEKQIFVELDHWSEQK